MEIFLDIMIVYLCSLSSLTHLFLSYHLPQDSLKKPAKLVYENRINLDNSRIDTVDDQTGKDVYFSLKTMNRAQTEDTCLLESFIICK